MPTARRYTIALNATAGFIENVPGCEALTLNLDELWARLDQLEEAEGETETTSP